MMLMNSPFNSEKNILIKTPQKYKKIFYNASLISHMSLILIIAIAIYDLSKCLNKFKIL